MTWKSQQGILNAKIRHVGRVSVNCNDGLEKYQGSLFDQMTRFHVTIPLQPLTYLHTYCSTLTCNYMIAPLQPWAYISAAAWPDICPGKSQQKSVIPLQFCFFFNFKAYRYSFTGISCKGEMHWSPLFHSQKAMLSSWLRFLPLFLVLSH